MLPPCGQTVKEHLSTPAFLPSFRSFFVIVTNIGNMNKLTTCSLSSVNLRLNVTLTLLLIKLPFLLRYLVLKYSVVHCIKYIRWGWLKFMITAQPTPQLLGCKPDRL